MQMPRHSCPSPTPDTKSCWTRMATSCKLWNSAWVWVRLSGVQGDTHWGLGAAGGRYSLALVIWQCPVHVRFV